MVHEYMNVYGREKLEERASQRKIDEEERELMLSQKVYGIEDAKFLRMMAAHNALETEQLDAEKQLYVISKMTG
jgi:hypothetical protein